MMIIIMNISCTTDLQVRYLFSNVKGTWFDQKSIQYSPPPHPLNIFFFLPYIAIYSSCTLFALIIRFFHLFQISTSIYYFPFNLCISSFFLCLSRCSLFLIELSLFSFTISLFSFKIVPLVINLNHEQNLSLSNTSEMMTKMVKNRDIKFPILVSPLDRNTVPHAPLT